MARKILAKEGGKVEDEVELRSHMSESSPNDVIAALKALEEVRESLGDAFKVLAERRSPVRILLTAVVKPQNFLDLPEDRVFEMRLAHLTWSETWRLIRSNLPTLLSYGDFYLSQLWSKLGANLERWEELERRVLHEGNKPGVTVNLQALAEDIAPRSAARPAGTGKLWHRRGQRPLRIAVAGKLIAGSSAIIVEALSRLAMENGIAGRVVEFDEPGALATLIDERREDDAWPHVIDWLQRITKKQPDIIVLDYDCNPESPEDIAKNAGTEKRILYRSMQNSSLLIAPGGDRGPHSDLVTTPSGYPEVLGVGPLDNNLKPHNYAEWHDTLGKPDLFMEDDLAATPLAAALGAAVTARQLKGSWDLGLDLIGTACSRHRNARLVDPSGASPLGDSGLVG